MTQSNIYPEIRRNKKWIIVPYNVKEYTVTDENDKENTFYKYNEHREIFKGKDYTHIDYWCKVIKKYLNEDLHLWIDKHYDQGIQSTLQALGQQAMLVGCQDAIKQGLMIFNWIDTVLQYYDSKKTMLENALIEYNIISVNWDFPNDVPLPKNMPSWRDVKNTLINSQEYKDYIANLK